MLASLAFNALETAGTIVWATAKQRHVPAALLGRVSSLDWLISIGLLPLSFALTGPVSAADRRRRRRWSAPGVIGGAVTFAALFLPGMRAVEGLGRRRGPRRVRRPPGPVATATATPCPPRPELEVDPLDGPVRRARDPHLVARDVEPERVRADLDRVADGPGGLGVDARQRAVVAVGDPDRAAADAIRFGPSPTPITRVTSGP